MSLGLTSSLDLKSGESASSSGRDDSMMFLLFRKFSFLCALRSSTHSVILFSRSFCGTFGIHESDYRHTWEEALESLTYSWIFALVLEFGDALVSDVFCRHGGVYALRARPPFAIPVDISVSSPPPRYFIPRRARRQVKSINLDDGAPFLYAN